MKKIFCCVLASLCALTAFVACKREEKKEITVYMPDGAPALALAGLMAQDTAEDGVCYRVVNAKGIESFVQFEDERKNADICLLPLTDASLYAQEKYALLGVVTHGNFFLLSETDEVYTKENLSALVGKKVGVVQLGKLPGLTLQAVLRREGIPFAVREGLEDCEADTVNLINILPTAVKKGAGFDLFAMPEPAVTVKTKNGFYRAGDLQALYGAENGYPQAVAVAKKSLIAQNGEWVGDFLTDLAESAQWLENAELSAVLSAVNGHLEEGITPSLTENTLTSEAIRRCGVYFASAMESKAEISVFLEDLRGVNANAVRALADGFYYKAE